MAVAATAVWMTALANAQTSANTQLLSAGLMQDFSAADVTSMLAEFEIGTAVQPYQGDETASMVATTSGGATFIITMLQCADAAAASGCKQAVIYTGMPNSGVAYDDLNTFHTNADVTRAINVPDQQMIVFGTQIFAQGGIGRENFQLLTALFLNDMQAYIQNQMSAATSVALRFEQKPQGKTGNISTVISTGARLPSPRIKSVDHALAAAVANTRNVEFLSEKAAQLVD